MKYFLMIIYLSITVSLHSQLKVDSQGSLEINSFADDYEKSNWTRIHNRYTLAYGLWNNYYEKDVFSVMGDGKVYSSYNYLTESDLSTKSDIQSIDSPLEKIIKMKGVHFKRVYMKPKFYIDTTQENLVFKEGMGKERANEPGEYGLIAQDLENVLPEAVFTMQDSLKAISYNSLIPLLIEAVKEQQIKIEEMESLLNEHEAKLQKIKRVRRWRIGGNDN